MIEPRQVERMAIHDRVVWKSAVSAVLFGARGAEIIINCEKPWTVLSRMQDTMAGCAAGVSGFPLTRVQPRCADNPVVDVRTFTSCGAVVGHPPMMPGSDEWESSVDFKRSAPSAGSMRKLVLKR